MKIETGSVLPLTTAGKLQIITDLFCETQEKNDYVELVFNDDGSPSIIPPIFEMTPDEVIKILDI